MNELCMRAVFEREGVDASKIKFLEVPFPEMTDALQKGRVDAISAVEPFVTQARAAGARDPLSYFAGLEPKTHGRDILHEREVHRRAQGRGRAICAGDEQVALLRPGPPGRGALDHPHYTKIPPPAAKT